MPDPGDITYAPVVDPSAPLDTILEPAVGPETFYVFGHATDGEGVRRLRRYLWQAPTPPPDPQSFPSNFIPSDDDLYTLGTATRQWILWASQARVRQLLLQVVVGMAGDNPILQTASFEYGAAVDKVLTLPENSGTLARLEDIFPDRGDSVYVLAVVDMEVPEGPGPNATGYTLSAFSRLVRIGEAATGETRFVRLSRWSQKNDRVVIVDPDNLADVAGIRWEISTEEPGSVDGAEAIRIPLGGTVEVVNMGGNVWRTIVQAPALAVVLEAFAAGNRNLGNIVNPFGDVFLSRAIVKQGRVEFYNGAESTNLRQTDGADADVFIPARDGTLAMAGFVHIDASAFTPPGEFDPAGVPTFNVKQTPRVVYQVEGLNVSGQFSVVENFEVGDSLEVFFYCAADLFGAYISMHFAFPYTVKWLKGAGPTAEFIESGENMRPLRLTLTAVPNGAGILLLGTWETNA